MPSCITSMKNCIVVLIFFTSILNNFGQIGAQSEGDIKFDDPYTDDDNDADTDDDEGSHNVNDHSWCFRMTWLGPKYDKDSNIKNETCKTLLKTTKGVPCVQPLVVSNNSNIPDTDLIWEMHNSKPNHIACRLVKGEVCARYEYIFSGATQNITYMCTKVNLENGTAPTSGCFKEERNGHLIRVCICQSAMGARPCNSANLTTHNILMSITLTLLVIFGIQRSWWLE